jgi:ribose transport system substrate-binding protein
VNSIPFTRGGPHMRAAPLAIAVLVLASLFATLAGAGVAKTDPDTARPVTAASQQKVKNIAFFGFAAANSFAQATWKGVQQAAKANHVKAKFFDPNFNSGTQVSQIQDAITSRQYQAFVVQANDGNAVVPVVKQAIAAGIKVVGEFTPIGPRYDTIKPQVRGLIFVGEAPVWNGSSLGKLGVRACGKKSPCRVAYLEGFKSLPLDNARTAAVHKVLKAAKNVDLVASVEGGYTQASGLKAAQDVLQAHPDVDVMIGSAQAIEGAQQAVTGAGKLGKIKLIGNGGSCQAVAAVRSGKWFATYVIAERSSGAKAARFAIAAGNGKKVPSSFDTRKLQNPIGTKANLNKTRYKAQYCD